jgi:hypothetical protein
MKKVHELAVERHQLKEEIRLLKQQIDRNYDV